MRRDDPAVSRARREIARIDRRRARSPASSFGELLRLRAAVVVQRRVRVTLKAPLAVPVGLAVACEEEGRHPPGIRYPPPWTLACATGAASSPAPRAASASRRRACSPRRAPASSRAAAAKRPRGRAVACRRGSRPAGEPARVVAEAAAALGGLDVLVNNVGAARQARFEEVPDDEWDAYWQLNVMSYVRAIRAALPHLESAGCDRQCLLDRRQAPLDRHAALLGHQGSRALALAPRRRPLRDGRRPLQRRHARARRRRTPGSATAGSPTSRATATKYSRRSAPAARWDVSRARGDRRRDRLPLLRPRLVRHRGRLERRRRHGPDHRLALDSDRPVRRLPLRGGGRGQGRRRVRAAHSRARGAGAVAARGALLRDARARARTRRPCCVRTPFQRDRDRIVHSKPFRRLKGKTQVFIDPAGRPLPHADDPHARDDWRSRASSRGRCG